MRMTKLKTIVISAAMLLGMGFASMPQAMAGGSALENWRLPWGMEFGKKVPEKLMRQAPSDFNPVKKYLKLSNGVKLDIKRGVLFKVGFIKKAPKAFRRLGLVVDKGKVDAIGIVRQQGGKVTDIWEDGSCQATFSSSPYHFFFNQVGDDGSLGSIWVSEKLEDF